MYSDVGGGSVPNDTAHSLARIPLRWMIRKCFRAKTGIIFDVELLRKFGLEPATVLDRRPERYSSKDQKIRASPLTPRSPISNSLAKAKALIPKEIFIILFFPMKHVLRLIYYSPGVKFVRRHLHCNKGGKKIVEVHEKSKSHASRAQPSVVDEQEEELHDALSPQYDRLAKQAFWWILEIIPILRQVQDGDYNDQFVRYVTFLLPMLSSVSLPYISE